MVGDRFRVCFCESGENVATFSEHVRCISCLEEFQYLVKPKKLPCQHIQCFDCLENEAVSFEAGFMISSAENAGKHNKVIREICRI